MSVFGEIGKLVFKTKQGSTLKLNKRGELVDPDTGAVVPYSANEVLDQDSLALYEKVKSGKIGSVNEVLSLGADKVPTVPTIDSLKPDAEVALTADGLTPNQQVQYALRKDLEAADGKFSSRDRVLGMLGNEVSPEVQQVAKGGMKGIGEFVADPTIRSVAGLGLGAAAMTESEDASAMPAKIISRVPELLANAPLAVRNAPKEQQDRWLKSQGVKDVEIAGHTIDEPKAQEPHFAYVTPQKEGLVNPNAVEDGLDSDAKQGYFEHTYKSSAVKPEAIAGASDHWGGFSAFHVRGFDDETTGTRKVYEIQSDVQNQYSGYKAQDIQWRAEDAAIEMEAGELPQLPMQQAKILNALADGMNANTAIAQADATPKDYEEVIKYLQTHMHLGDTSKSAFAKGFNWEENAINRQFVEASNKGLKQVDFLITTGDDSMKRSKQVEQRYRTTYRKQIEKQAAKIGATVEEVADKGQNTYLRVVLPASFTVPAFAQEDPDAELSELVTNMVKSGKMTAEEAYQIFKQEVPEQADKLLAPMLEAHKQSLRAQGANPWAVAKEMESKFGQPMNIPQMFTPDMPPEAIIQAVEKVHAQPWAQAKELGALVSDEARVAIKEHSNQLASVIAAELQNRGFEVRVQDDEDGSPIVEFLDEETGEWKVAESGSIRSLAGAAFQIAGGIGGFAAGARAAGALVPPIGLPGVAAKAGLTAIGTGLGAMAGSTVDHLAAAAVLKQQLDTRELLARAAEDGVADAVLGLGVDVVLRGGAKTYQGVKAAYTMARNAVDNFMLQGALKELENITGLTKAQRQELATKLEEVSENTMARNEARREIEGVLQTRPGMEILVGEASRLSKTAGFGMLKEIDTRAKSVLDATREMTAGNVSRVVTDELGRYRRSVKKGYEGIKQLGASEAQQAGFRYDPATVIDVPKLIADAEAGITDPSKLSRLDAFTARIAKIGAESDKEFGLAELLDYRLALKQFKESGQFNYTANQRAERMLADIDKEIDKAVQMMPNGKVWQEQFKQANVEYSKMKALEENVMYKALNKPGASADDTVRALAKYIKAEDGTFMKVMGKLPPHVRNNVEGAVIRDYAMRYTAGDEQGFQAIDFPGLARDLDGISFTTKGGQDLKRVVDKLAKVYQNDPDLRNAAGAIQLPKNKTYLATSISGRANMWAHNQLFNYVSRYLPTQQGRTRRLAEAISDVLDNPLSAKSVEKLTRELPGDPNLKTTLQQLSISYAERGQRETYPKVPLYKVYQEGYSQSTKQTKYGDGIEYFTSKEAAEKAKASGQIVEEVLVEPSRYATIDQAGMLLGRELTPEDLKQARVVQDLKKHGFLGIADGDLVFEFK